jgi:hypothetical protein
MREKKGGSEKKREGSEKKKKRGNGKFLIGLLASTKCGR